MMYSVHNNSVHGRLGSDETTTHHSVNMEELPSKGWRYETDVSVPSLCLLLQGQHTNSCLSPPTGILTCLPNR